MLIDINEDQKEIRENIIEYICSEVNPYIVEEKFSNSAWEACAKGGLLAYNLEETYGDIKYDATTQMLITEAIGYSCKDSGFVFAMNNHLWACQAVIQRFGSQSVKDKYLRKMGNGNCIGAYAITENEAGSDNSNMKTSFKSTENGFVLNGTKTFISNASIADVFVVISKDLNKKGISAYSAFVVDKNFPGVEIKEEIPKMGLKACPMAEVSFHECFIPKENLLGKLNSGITVVNYAMMLERFYEFVSHIGAMRRIMSRCMDYSKIREQSGKRIEEYQMISSKIVRMRINIQLAIDMAIRIASLLDKNKNAYMEVSMFKIFVSEKYAEVCKDAMQIHGAYGYLKENPIEQETRDSLAASIYAGTNEVQTNIIYRLMKYEQYE